MNKSKTAKTEKEKKLSLEVKARTVFGKKLKKIRKEGFLPSNIFGPNFKSQSVSANYKDFINVYRIAKETGIVYLKSGTDEIPALIKMVQLHPVSGIILHVDFRKIDLKQSIQTEVPVKIIGQSEAVVQKSGVLLTLADKLLVEALPQDIPQSIEVDIALLKEIGNEIKVSDLSKSTKYQIKEDLNKVIVSVIEHKEESVVPETTAAPAPEVITEAAKPEGEEATAATPSETPPAEKKPADKKPAEKPSQK